MAPSGSGLGRKSKNDFRPFFVARRRWYGDEEALLRIAPFQLVIFASMSSPLLLTFLRAKKSIDRLFRLPLAAEMPTML